MVEEIDELITDMKAIINISDKDEIVETASHAAELLAALKAIMPPTLNKRRCHACGRVAYHAANITPYVCCAKCDSQDTRLIRSRVDETCETDKSAPKVMIQMNGLVQSLPEVSGTSRAETQPMKFGSDWCGVFIRGDDCGRFAKALSLCEPQNSGVAATLTDLILLLEASLEHSQS